MDPVDASISFVGSSSLVFGGFASSTAVRGTQSDKQKAAERNGGRRPMRIPAFPTGTKLTLAAGCLLTFLSAGCTLEHSVESASLCKVSHERGWSFSKDYPTNARRDDHGYTFLFDFFDTGSANDKRGTMPGAYWVRITGLTFGSADPKLRRPMIYDPSEAILTIDGKSLSAMPILWRSRQVDGRDQPGSTISTPTDINVMDRGLTSSFFIAFETEPPSAKQSYTVDFGAISLDGKRAPLPVYESCHSPSRTWWSPIK